MSEVRGQKSEDNEKKVRSWEAKKVRCGDAGKRGSLKALRLKKYESRELVALDFMNIRAYKY